MGASFIVVVTVILIFMLIFVYNQRQTVDISGVWQINNKDKEVFGIKEYILYINK